MHDIAKVVEELFYNKGWTYSRTDDLTFQFGFRAHDIRFDMQAHIGEDRPTLVIYLKIPFHTPKEHFPAVAEFICRANWDLVIGNFELDYLDGEIRYKVSALYDVHPPEVEEVNQMIDICLAMGYRFYGGFGAVIYGGVFPETAFLEIEEGL